MIFWFKNELRHENAHGYLHDLNNTKIGVEVTASYYKERKWDAIMAWLIFHFGGG